MFWAVLMCFSPYLGIECPGGGGSPKGLGHITRFSRLPTAPQAGIVAALVLLNLWFWRVLSRLALPLHAQGLVHNLLVQFFPLDSAKIEVCENYLFDIVFT